MQHETIRLDVNYFFVIFLFCLTMEKKRTEFLTITDL